MSYPTPTQLFLFAHRAMVLSVRGEGVGVCMWQRNVLYESISSQLSGLYGIGTLDLCDTGAALAPHHYLKESPRLQRHASVNVASLSRQLETGDGNFFDVHAPPVLLYNDGPTPGVRLFFLIVYEHHAIHNSPTAISFASKLDEVTYENDLIPYKAQR